MPQIDASEVIAAPAERVWAALNDVESYPRVMDHIRSVTVIERGSDYRLIAWDAELKGCAMKWTEREDIRPAEFRIDYRQVKGNLAVFEGYWQLEPLGETSCRVTLVVRFDMGLPMLAGIVNPIAEKVFRENCRKMIAAIALQADALTAERERV